MLRVPITAAVILLATNQRLGQPGPGGYFAPDASTFEAIRALASLYGPGNPIVDRQVREIRTTSEDLDDDGLSERVAILLDDNHVRQLPTDLVSLEDGIICRGFVVFKKVEGKWWPVLYRYFDWGGRSLRLEWIDGLACAQLVSAGGKDGLQFRWGWDRPSDASWLTPAWTGYAREWKAETNAYGTWRRTGQMAGTISLK